MEEGQFWVCFFFVLILVILLIAVLSNNADLATSSFGGSVP